MKNKILNLFVFFIVNLYFTQILSNTENYVYSRTYLEAVTSENPTAKQLQNIVYYDGLGRPKQNIAIKYNSRKDLVVPITYDSYGRQTKSVLPVPVTTLNGNIQNISEADANSYYNVLNAYSESVFDDSPLNRIIKSAFPGDDWEKSGSHTVDYEYDINTANDSIKKYSVTTVWNTTKEIYTSTLNTPSLYSKGELYKYKITDENRNINEIYQNASGQTILIRKNDGTNKIDTYYVYDNSDNIAFIITPKAVPINISTNPSALDDLCYQYNYDEWGRLAEKKLPGKAWEYLAYDKYNRLVATSIKNSPYGGWLISKYDWKGRIAYTAITSGGDRTSFQSSLNNSTATEYENFQPVSVNGLSFKYTSQSFPTTISELLTVYNYDFYPSDAPVIMSPVLGQDLLTDDAENNNISTLSMPTASYVKNIGEKKWTKNYIWYDTKGRTIVNHRENHLGGYTKNETKLDFAGFPLESITKHKRLSTDATEVVISERFVYDSSYRLKNHFHKVGNQNEVLLSNLSYNEIGQLVSNTVGDALQTINYTYNVRGWLKSINDPNNLNGDLFGLKLRYNEAVQEEYPSSAYSTEKVVPKYNGNISEVEWKTAYASNEPLRRYGYIYDGLDRLKAAYYNDYSNPQKDEFFEKLTYDLNGNINTLKRSGQYSPTVPYVIDNLTYTYTGNQLKKIVDATNNNSGYLTYDPTNPEMTYDENGNMTSQMSKRISTINYNFLDLPTYATTIGKGAYNLTFVYRADGVKVSKSYKSGISAARVTEYLDGFQYYNNVLQFVPTTEGYYDFVNNRYVYQYKDQVGNVRLSYYKDSNNLPKIDKETNYYPFGLEHTYNGGVPANGNYKYTYQGNEKQEIAGWLDFGARNYMPDIGRWSSSDPLAELRPDLSPYRFAYNNPISVTDPTGMSENAGGDWDEENDAPEAERIGRFSIDPHWNNNYNESLSRGEYTFFYAIRDVVTLNWGVDFDISFGNGGDSSYANDFRGGEDSNSYENFGNDEEPVNLFGKKEIRPQFSGVAESRSFKENDGKFNVFGHGSLGLLQNGDTDEFITNAEQFDKMMSKYSPNWEKSKDKKGTILTIWACNSAQETSRTISLIARISKAHPNITVIGADGFINYVIQKNGLYKIGSIDKVQDSGDRKGELVLYRNGKEIYRKSYEESVKNH